MRVLILSTLLAYVAAAPSGVALAPSIVPVVGVPAIIPANPGDLQAAAIDAKVFAEDQARAIIDAKNLAEDQAREEADKAKALAEQVLEDQKLKAAETEVKAEEAVQEAIWAGEDKKWQAIDAVKTAEAQIDGALAKDSPAIARSAFSGIILPAPLVPSIQPQIITPIGSPFVYAAPGIISPVLKAFPEPTKEEKPEILTKSVEEKPEEKQKEVEKVKELEGAKELGKIGFAYQTLVAIPPQFIQPGLKAAFPIQPLAGQFLAPTVIKTQW